MNNDSIHERFLRSEVTSRFGREVSTSKDFEMLSASIEERTHSSVSSSTLKRFWGYMSLHPRPRTQTLDVLSRYIGRPGWSALCRELDEGSAFFSAETLRSADLKEGALVKLSWLPDRLVTLRHLGGGSFRVEDSGTSKLRPGDEFEALGFMVGHPLYIGGILRSGKRLPEYVAGRSAGLSGVEISQG